MESAQCDFEVEGRDITSDCLVRSRHGQDSSEDTIPSLLDDVKQVDTQTIRLGSPIS